MEPGQKSWMLVVDTNEYSGGFERELCAYVTGMTAENAKQAHYQRYVALFRKELGVADSINPDVFPEDFPFGKLIAMELVEHDDLGFMSYCTIYPTPGRSNDGHGKHYTVPDEGPYAYPAYESVCIFLARSPTIEEFEQLKKRALAFPAAARQLRENTTFAEDALKDFAGNEFKVIGVRLIRRTIVDEEISP